MIRTFQHPAAFELESGSVLPSLHLAYTSHGELNAEKDNVIWIFHALTANSDPAEWWPGLVGEGKIFDPSNSFIICVNMPGSCYGSLGPLDKDPRTRASYYHDFPFFTTRDMIRAYQLLKQELGITKIKTGIGGSMGGQQLLEWAIEEPSLFERIIPIATNAFHSPWGIAFNATQRMAITNDPTWKNKNDQAGMEGMKAARAIALLSYRNYFTYHKAQSEDDFHKTDDFKSESYQRYQGEKLAKRFNAFSYYFLSKSMDAHNLGRKRAGITEALRHIKAKALVISISSDILFPPEEQFFLASQIPDAVYETIDSNYGHDGFLLEFDPISKLIEKHLIKETIQ